MDGTGSQRSLAIPRELPRRTPTAIAAISTSGIFMTRTELLCLKLTTMFPRRFLLLLLAVTARMSPALAESVQRLSDGRGNTIRARWAALGKYGVAMPRSDNRHVDSRDPAALFQCTRCRRSRRALLSGTGLVSHPSEKVANPYPEWTARSSISMGPVRNH